METEEIKAILDTDFEELLRRLGVYDQVSQGNAKCAFCDQAVNLSNVSMVFPDKGEVRFCCDSKECVDKLMKQREKGR